MELRGGKRKPLTGQDDFGRISDVVEKIAFSRRVNEEFQALAFVLPW